MKVLDITINERDSGDKIFSDVYLAVTPMGNRLYRLADFEKSLLPQLQSSDVLPP